MVNQNLFVGTLLSHVRWLIAVPVLALGWFAPRFGDPWLNTLETLGGRFATRKRAVVWSIAITAIVTRLALFWRMPIPVPDTQDEFSYLLAADTFAHGRLSNAPHPLWIFFDTFHVLQHPTYQSIYPPSQGAVLAAGQVLGHPWVGVLLAMAIMCAAVTWALQGWFPPRWALLGGVLVLLRIHLFSYWLESYWGGAVAALGGALVLGALPRVIHHLRVRDALVMGIGTGLLANSRPFEGFLFCIPVGVALLVWLRGRQSPPLTITGLRLLVPLSGLLALTIAFIGYYNWRVTGDVLVLPHVVDQRQYESLPVFVWGTAQPPRHYLNPQFEDFYNVVTRKEYMLPLAKLSWNKCYAIEQFFFGSVLWIPFVTLPWMLRDCRPRLLWLQFAWCILGLMAVVWFQPHYAAPLTATIFALLIQAMRHLRRWELKGRPVGIFLTRLVVLLVLARGAIYIWRPPLMQEEWSRSRAKIVNQLESLRKEQLVLVRYAPNHNVHDEWVYNVADIDHSKVIWAREIPGVDLNPLLEYFRGRTVWLLEPDRVPVQLRPYPSATPAEGLNPSP